MRCSRARISLDIPKAARWLFATSRIVEDALLDPEKYPALLDLDLIVELHECFKSAITGKICSRFEASHDITVVPHALHEVKLPKFFQEFGHLDQLLAIWEWRTGPTPWAVMLRKA